VSAVQRALIKRGYKLGSYTPGVYDAATAAAVSRYKSGRPSLGTSNMVGPRTYRSITSALRPPSTGGGGTSTFASWRSRAPYGYTTASYARWYATQRLAAYGWSASQMSCLRPMWIGESHWSYREVTGRYIGIPQTTVGVVNKYGYSESSYRANPEVQVEVGLKYIRDRYGSPCAAWAFWKRQGAWQDKNDPEQWWGGWY